MPTEMIPSALPTRLNRWVHWRCYASRQGALTFVFIAHDSRPVCAVLVHPCREVGAVCVGFSDSPMQK